MKKLGIAVVLSLVVVLSIGTANALVWEDYFPDDPIFDGGVFINDTAETDVTEQQKELEKDWLEHEIEMFPPGWANETPSGILPPGWANETLREEWTDKPANWFNEVPKEQHSNFPLDWFDIV